MKWQGDGESCPSLLRQLPGQRGVERGIPEALPKKKKGGGGESRPCSAPGMGDRRPSGAGPLFWPQRGVLGPNRVRHCLSSPFALPAPPPHPFSCRSGGLRVFLPQLPRPRPPLLQLTPKPPPHTHTHGGAGLLRTQNGGEGQRRKRKEGKARGRSLRGLPSSRGQEQVGGGGHQREREAGLGPNRSPPPPQRLACLQSPARHRQRLAKSEVATARARGEGRGSSCCGRLGGGDRRGEESPDPPPCFPGFLARPSPSKAHKGPCPKRAAVPKAHLPSGAPIRRSSWRSGPDGLRLPCGASASPPAADSVATTGRQAGGGEEARSPGCGGGRLRRRGCGLLPRPGLPLVPSRRRAGDEISPFSLPALIDLSDLIPAPDII